MLRVDLKTLDTTDKRRFNKSKIHSGTDLRHIIKLGYEIYWLPILKMFFFFANCVTWYVGEIIKANTF